MLKACPEWGQAASLSFKLRQVMRKMEGSLATVEPSFFFALSAERL